MTETQTAADSTEPDRSRRKRRWPRRFAISVAALVAAVTAASFAYNLATDGPAPRPSGLRFARGGGFETRYRQWGTSGTPVVLVPGAFETADTFYALGPALAAARHRVYAIDLIGTGYSVARPMAKAATVSGAQPTASPGGTTPRTPRTAPTQPFSAGNMARQLIAFEKTEGLTGADAPILLGHSAGAAVAGLAALSGTRYARGIVFLDGDATPLGGSGNNGGGGGSFLGALLVNPFKTSLIRLATSQDWLVKSVYNSMCGPTCPRLDAAGVATWADPLRQPGFESYLTYEAAGHGIPSLAPEQFTALRASRVPKLVIFGAHDPQMPASDARETARRIGAPAPEFVPGRHLTMIASPRQITADLDRFAALNEK